MVRLKTIVGVNGINKYMGYGEIEILSRKALLERRIDYAGRIKSHERNS